MEQTGRLTLPTDADVVAETLRLKNLLGADALRDCDGTEMPQELLTDPAKKYATYYTTRKDNAWAEANPDEVQQEYLISDRHTARGTKLRIHLMDGFHTQQLKVNTRLAVKALGKPHRAQVNEVFIACLILAEQDKNTALFGECKWTNEKVDLSVLETLIKRSELFPYKNVHYYLFAKTGFTKGCTDRAKEMGNVALVRYEDMLR